MSFAFYILAIIFAIWFCGWVWFSYDLVLRKTLNPSEARRNLRKSFFWPISIAIYQGSRFLDWVKWLFSDQ